MEFSPTTMDRRSFIRNATLAALGLTAAGAAGQDAAFAGPKGKGGGPTGKRPVPRGKISIQLYSLRDITGTATDRDMVFETLREIGYRKVEPYTNYGTTWSELGDTLRSHDLEPSSMHNGDRNPDSAVQASLDLGVKYTNFPFARYGTLDEWRALAHELNPVAAAMADAGVQYGYHNHDAEFTVEENGVQAYDVLLEEFIGHMQLDLYWAVTGGADPVEVFSRDEGRFLQFHVKDKDADTGFFADPGEGFIDFPRIFAARKESGVKEYITENDSPADELEFAETGFDYLRNLRY